MANAQCPTSSFSLPSNPCTNAPIDITNSSTGALSYEWNLCSGAIDATPTAESITTINSASTTTGLDLFSFEGNDYAFVTSRGNSQIFLMVFDDIETDVDDDVSVISYGNIGGILSGPESIRVIIENGNVYALISNYNSSTMAFVDFGEVLDGTFVSADLLDVDEATLARPSDIWVEPLDNDYVVFVGNRSGTAISRLYFENTITASPDGVNITVVDWPRSISVVRSCDSWYGFVAGEITTQLYHLDFGTDLTNTSPAVNLMTLGGDALIRPFSIKPVIDKSEFQFLISTSSSLMKLEVGADPSATSANLVDEGDFGQLTSVLGFDIIDFGDKIIGAGLISSANEPVRIIYDSECTGSIIKSTNEIPFPVSYGSSGTHRITLKTTDAEGDVDYFSNTVNVSTDLAPDISFSMDTNECEDVEMTFNSTFTPQPMRDDPTYVWSVNGSDLMGPGEDEADLDYTFADPNEYEVRLSVDDGTCENFYRDSLQIYPVPPTPSFDVDTSPTCANGAISFTNTTSEGAHVGATIQYTWDYDGEATSNDVHGSFVFNATGEKDITLTMGINGCSTISGITMIDILEGPTPAFSIDDSYCFDDENPVQFTDQSTISSGSITGHDWDFGDMSGSSTDSDPFYQYASPGDYDITLTITSNLGCENSIQGTVRVDGTPIPDFIADLACLNTTTLMTDNSSPGDVFNNITSRVWRLNGSVVSTEENPLIEFSQTGAIEVSLTVANDAGCDATDLQNVEVLPAPDVNFDVNASCVNQNTEFVNTTTLDEGVVVSSLLWTIDDEVYLNQNPEILFTEEEEYEASLQVSSSNGCEVVETKNFVITGAANLIIHESNNCTNQETTLTDETEMAVGVISRSWSYLGETIGTDASVDYPFTTSGEYDVLLTVEDELGCISQSNKIFSVYTPPQAVSVTENNIGPPPLTVDFSHESIGASSVIWNFGIDGVDNSTESSTSHTYDDFGNYEAFLVAANDQSCYDTAYVEVAAVDPIFDLELIAVNTETNDDRMNFFLDVTNNGTQSVYGFDIIIKIDGESSIIETYSETLDRNESINVPISFSIASDNIDVELVCFKLNALDELFEDQLPFNNEGCVNFEARFIVNDPYPNPLSQNTDQLVFQMVLPAKHPVQIVMSDSFGNTVHNEIFTSTSEGLNTVVIDSYDLKTGMYFLHVIYDRSSSTRKIIKL